MKVSHDIVESIVESQYCDSGQAQVRASLEAAAVLVSGLVVGDAAADVEQSWVNDTEWAHLSARDEVSGGSVCQTGIVDFLVAYGLAQRSEKGADGAQGAVSGLAGASWRFCGSECVRMLNETSRVEKRWAGYHAACARMLSKLYDRHGRDVQGRVVAGRSAQHLVLARRLDEALEMFLVAQKTALDSDNHDECLVFLDMRASLLDQMEISRHSPFRAQNHICRARSCFMRGDINRAEGLVKRGLKVLRRSGWAAETGQALLLFGRIRAAQYRHVDALRFIDDAGGYLAVAGDENGLTRARATRAYVMVLQGDYAAARERILKTVGIFESLGDCFMVAMMHNYLAQTWLGNGNRAEAIEAVSTAQSIATQKGYRSVEGTAWMMRGEIARRSENLDPARTYYSRALALFVAENNRLVHVARFNIALVEIGARNFSVAHRILAELAGSYAEDGYRSKLPLVYAALMVCAVGRGDWDGWEKNSQLFRVALPDIGGVHEDIAWLAQSAARFLTARINDEGGGNRAEIMRLRDLREQFFTLAREQHEALGNIERLEALRLMVSEAVEDAAASSS